MGDKLVECPKCGQQNNAAAEKCSKCGIGFAWWRWVVVSGPQEHDAPLILHVDDESSLLSIVENMLHRGGYRVAKALDGYEALDLASRLLPDLIITGIMMPGMSGIELIQRLKASPTLQNIPVFVLASIDLPQQAFEAGAVKYLTKPVLHHDLIGAVRSFFEGWPVILIIHQNVAWDVFRALLERRLWTEWSSSQAAISPAKAIHPDVIVLPFHLPESDGLDLLTRFKADPDVGSIPVVMLADHPEPDLEQRALELGAYAVYTGPLDVDKLVAVLPPLPAHESRQREI